MSRNWLRGLVLGTAIVAAVATAAYLFLVVELSEAYGESPPKGDRDAAG